MKKRIILVLLVLFMLFIVGCETAESHNFSNQYSYDNDYHWYDCEDDDCVETKDKEPHTFDGLECEKCDYKKEPPKHEHTFKEDYQYDETAHYRLCEYEGCTEKTDFENHKFGEPNVSYDEKYITNTYICEVCKYTKEEKIEINNKVDDSVQWDDAFKNFELTNFEMKVLYEEEGKEMENHCIVTDKVVFYHIEGYEKFYSEKTNDGYIVYEYDYETNKFNKYNDPEGFYFIGASTETVLRISFATYFDKFVYDEETKSYICEEELVSDALDWDGTVYGQVLSLHTTVKVENGKIVEISSRYTFIYPDGERDDVEQSFKYYNIGKATLEIPQDVIDAATEIEKDFE